MALYADRVKETSTSTGTGTINLAGAVTGFRTFVAGLGTGNPVCYCIQHATLDEWEVGIGTVTDATPDTLSRTHVISSSNANALVNFSSGDKVVFCTFPNTSVSGHSGLPPASPDSRNDEFTTDALDGDWSVVDGMTMSAGTVTPNGDWGKGKSWLTAQAAGNATATAYTYRIRKAITGLTAGTAFSYYTRMAMSCRASQNCRVQQMLSVSGTWGGGTSGEQLYLSLQKSGSNYQVGVYDNSFTLGTLTLPHGTHDVMWCLRRTTSNVVDVWISLDEGVTWQQVIDNNTRNWEVAYINLNFIGPNSTGQESWHGIDYVRFNDDRFKVPFR